MTTRGKLVLTLLVLGLAGYGAWRWWDKLAPQSVLQSQADAAARRNATTQEIAKTAAAANASAKVAEVSAALTETLTEIPKLAAPGIYQMKGDVVEVELSEYAGYAGLIVANGGLEPNENSLFFKKHGFKVKLTLSEEESWSALNIGKIAASATTVDVLAAYGRQFQVIVPAQIGFSRGADGVVVRSDIKRINDLKGRILVTAQFTEADFFIRYLAQEAGLSVNMLPDLKIKPDPGKLNLVFCSDAFAAGDLFLKDVQSGNNLLAGCVTWAPKTTELTQQSGGKSRIIATSVNLLIVADILVVNKGFAQQHPEKIAGLVEGLIEGNRLVRDNPAAQLDSIGKAFKWDREKTSNELAKVHLSNLPENLAFFSGAIDAAGSFGSIYQSAVLAYGSALIKDPADSDRFLDLKQLKALEKAGTYKDQKIAISPIRSGSAATLENNPLLSKDIRFLFSPNSANLELNQKDNLKNLEAIKQLLQVSPGSTMLLRGHVDNALIDEFRRKGGETFVRQMSLKAMELSKNRAAEIKRLLVERFPIDAARIETVGRGWEEPAGTDNEQNRRVEAQWFTVE
jgi:NitT/TauT family transport system substrate-binding protein